LAPVALIVGRGHILEHAQAPDRQVVDLDLAKMKLPHFSAAHASGRWRPLRWQARRERASSPRAKAPMANAPEATAGTFTGGRSKIIVPSEPPAIRGNWWSQSGSNRLLFSPRKLLPDHC